MNGDTLTKTKMDNMYRWTRHVYDASRKYYLLGRDRLIENLNAQNDEHICEVGCGTARNLIKMVAANPYAHYYGLDASDEMLKTARQSLRREKLDDTIVLQQGFAQSFDSQSLFALNKPLNKIVFSYALSIIPPWQESIDHALKILPSGGEIHVVDFGGMEEQPAWLRRFLFWWLSLFHVYHKPEVLEHMRKLAKTGKGSLKIEHLYKGYAFLAVFKKS